MHETENLRKKESILDGMVEEVKILAFFRLKGSVRKKYKQLQLARIVGAQAVEERPSLVEFYMCMCTRTRVQSGKMAG